MLLLIGTGGWDVLSDIAFPPGIDAAAPDIVFHIYGLYLATGAIMVLAAIAAPWKCRARRLERAGLGIVATATLTLSVILVASGVVDNHLNEHAIFAVGIAATVRWWVLRNPGPPKDPGCGHGC